MFCGHCGAKMTPMIVSWFCPRCEVDESEQDTRQFGYVIVDTWWVASHINMVIPVGELVLWYRTRDIVNDAIDQMPMGYAVALGDVTDEPNIVWSTTTKHVLHTTTTPIKIDII